MESKEIIELAKAAKNGRIEVVIRNGEAEKFLDPVKPIEESELLLTGAIGTISEFLKKRYVLFEPTKCNISINESENKITFRGNECQANNMHMTGIIGKLEFTDHFKNLSLDDEFESKELARHLRKRKNLFSDPEKFKLLWGALSTFEAEISKRIESSDDKRGNIRSSIQQEVTSNLPNKFNLSIQIFKNAPKINFEVEIDVNANNLGCSMISFDLEEKIEQQRKDLFESELETEIYEGMLLKDFCVVYYC